MVREARSSKLGRRPIRDAGRALEDLSYGGASRGKPRPFQVVDFFGYNIADVCDRGIVDGVHMVYHCNSPKGQHVVPHHRLCGDSLEGH